LKKQKVISFLVGLFFVILCLETGLRIVGWIYQDKTRNIDFPATKKDGQYTILCLGDSFTYGLGAPEGKDYPRRLEDLLKTRLKKEKIKVINYGRAGKNTAYILDKTQYIINKQKPDLIIFLAGSANIWDLSGYKTYLEKINFASWTLEQLYNLRIFKLIKLSILNIKKNKVNKLLLKTDKHISANSELKNSDIKFLKGQIKKYPNIGVNYAKLGRIYFKQNDPEKALTYFKKGIAAAPNTIDSYYNMGQIYLRMHKREKALEWFRKTAVLFPNNAKNCTIIGRILKNQQKYQEAREWFKKALKINPKSGEAYCGMAWTYGQNSEFETAIEWFKKGTIADPNSIDNYYGLGQIYRAQHKYDEGLAFFQSVNTKCSEVKQFIRIFEKKEKYTREITNWIESDTRGIIEICVKNNIPIILQNYPEKYEGFDWSSIFNNIAKQYSLPIVDQYQSFNELWKQGEKRDDYFVQDGHCNAKGYAAMAKNVYDKIIELKLIDKLN